MRNHFCVGLGLFLTFAALVLSILTNVAQLSQNIVSRHIRMVKMDTSGLPSALSNSGVSVPSDFVAPNQRVSEGAGNGIKHVYEWGLYSFCAGGESSGDRACSERHFGYEWKPLDVIVNDAPESARSDVRNFLSRTKLADHKHSSKAAMYLVFMGTIFVAFAWICGFFGHHIAFLFGAVCALLAAVLLGVGAAVYTAIYSKAKHSVGAQYGVTIGYGNALWFVWASFVACALAIVPYIISCCTGRSKY